MTTPTISRSPPRGVPRSLSYFREREKLLPWIYVFGHGLQYGAACITALLHNDRGWKYISYSGLMVQVAASVGIIGAIGVRIRYAWLYLTLLAYLLWLALLGVLNANGGSYFLADLLAFGLLLGVSAGGSPIVLDRLAHFYSIALIPGSLVALLLVAQFEPGSIAARFRTEDAIDTLSLRGLCLPAVFLVLMSGRRDRLTSISAAAGLVAIGLYGWFTVSRTELIIALSTPCLGALAGRPVRSVAAWFLVAVAFASIVASSAFGVDRLLNSAESAIARFVGNSDALFDSAAISAGRDLEAKAFADATSTPKWIVGRGLGGAYFGFLEVANPNGLNMVHFGHLHLILKGGVVLLALISVLTLLGISVGFLRRGTPAAGAAAFLVLTAIINLGYASFLPTNTMAFYGLALGCALTGLSRQRSISLNSEEKARGRGLQVVALERLKAAAATRR